MLCDMMVFRVSPLTIFSIVIFMLGSAEKYIGKRMIEDIPYL